MPKPEQIIEEVIEQEQKVAELHEQLEEAEEELEEVREDLQEAFDRELQTQEIIEAVTGSEPVEEIVEELEHVQEQEKEDIETWLENQLKPISETIQTLQTTLLAMNSDLVEMKEQLMSSIPIPSEEATNTNETMQEISSIQTEPESLAENAEEEVEEVIEQVTEPVEKLAREIHKL